MSSTGDQPLLRIVTPHTTPEEIAAIVAVFSALGGSTSQPPRPASTWSSVGRRIGAPDVAGVGHWRASALPR